MKATKILKVRKPNITKQRHEEAREFLVKSPIGRRIRAAEHTLILLLKDDLPVLKHFIFNASYDARVIREVAEFERLLDGNPNLENLIKLSGIGGHIRTSFEKEQIRFFLFYEERLTVTEADLFSKTLGQVVAATFGALGLDMTGLMSVDESRQPTISPGSLKSQPKSD